MFVVNLKYTKSSSEINKELENHRAFLDKYLKLNKLVCSGSKNPKVGCILIFKGKNLMEIESIIQEDPFNKNKLAEYEIIEFLPTRYAEGFEKYIKE